MYPCMFVTPLYRTACNARPSLTIALLYCCLATASIPSSSSPSGGLCATPSKCRTPLASSRRDIAIQICRHSTTTTLHLQGGLREIYRARVTSSADGTTILSQPPVYYCSNSLAIIPLPTLRRPGHNHTIEILNLYSNWSLDTPPSTNDAIVLSHVALHTPSRNGSALQQYPRPTSCSTSTTTGWWVVNNNATTARTLATTCLPGWRIRLATSLQYNADGAMTLPIAQQCPATVRIARSVGAAGLMWQPHACSLRRHEEYDLQACSAAQRVCFVGDSQMRVLKTILAGLLGVPSQLPDNVHVYERKIVVNHPAIGFAWNPWGRVQLDGQVHVQDAVNASRLESCSMVVMNTGQWQASHHMYGCLCTGGSLDNKHYFWHKIPRYKHQGKPASLEQYNTTLHAAAVFLAALRDVSKKRVYWATTNPVQVRRDFHGPHARKVAVADWRTDAVLLQYNAAARAVMQHYGVPVLDLHAVAAPLSDLSYDSTHYIGDVGYAQAQLVLQELCSGCGWVKIR